LPLRGQGIRWWSVREVFFIIGACALVVRCVCRRRWSGCCLRWSPDGFALCCCGPRAAPFALVAAYQWEDYVDLVTIRCFDRVTTARVPAPRHGRVDVFTRRLWCGPMNSRRSGHCGRCSI
jgi:hypothetical protein